MYQEVFLLVQFAEWRRERERGGGINEVFVLERETKRA